MKQVSVIILGAGNRGTRYASIMSTLPECYNVVAVADPAKGHRDYIQQMHNIPDNMCFKSWQEALAQPKMADIAVIATVDSQHYEPALLAIEKGYDLLLEKPVAQTAKECNDIRNAANAKGVKVLVCHVLRYTPFYGRLKQLLMDGTIGQVLSIDQVEGVGHLHYAHSYVRGNWHVEEDSAPMLLAKCCHDLDIIQWLMDKKCTRVQSFGTLTHFTAENAPEGAPQSCVDGDCPHRAECPYDCLRHYYENKKNERRAIIATGISKEYEPTDEEVLEALRKTNYGTCAYHSNNNVVDHQVVSMEFENGAVATLNMNAFNKGGRYTRIYGTKGEIYAHMKDQQIKVFTFDGRGEWMVDVRKVDETIRGGHGGGDQGIIGEMYDYFMDQYTGFRAADINVSVDNHLIGFAAEKARHDGTVVDVQKFMTEV